MNGSWARFTLLSLLVVTIVWPTPASTTPIHEDRGDGISLIDLFGTTYFWPLPSTDFTTNTILPSEHDFTFHRTDSMDLVTVAIVNEVLWNLVTMDQVDRQWLTPLITDAKGRGPGKNPKLS